MFSGVERIFQVTGQRAVWRIIAISCLLWSPAAFAQIREPGFFVRQSSMCAALMQKWLGQAPSSHQENIERLEEAVSWFQQSSDIITPGLVSFLEQLPGYVKQGKTVATGFGTIGEKEIRD